MTVLASNLCVYRKLFALAVIHLLYGIAIAQDARVWPTNRAQTVRIASFNIRILSNKSRDDTKLKKICEVVGQYDLVAIQELRDLTILRRVQTNLQQSMQVEWRFDASEPVGRGVKERYAFLYRSDRVAVVSAGRLVPDPKDKFIREPFYASFRAGHFDFTLLTIHSLYLSKNAPERKLEFDALAKAFQYVQEADAKENDVILLGDFNDAPDNSRMAAINSLPSIHHLIDPPDKTTISNSSLYDNIFFQTNCVVEFAGRSGVDYYDRRMYPDGNGGSVVRKASLDVSDHRPVWAEFSTAVDDD